MGARTSARSTTIFVSEPLIGLDARLTRQMSVGMKAYVKELVARLPGQAPDLHFVVFTNERGMVTGTNVRVVHVNTAQSVNGSIAEQFAYPRTLRSQPIDLLHCMSVYTPRFSPQPYVYTIHDLIHLRFPQYFSWKVPPYYRFVVGPVARAASMVITDTCATIADLHQFLGVDPGQVRVVSLGVAETFVLDNTQREQLAVRARARFGLTRPYFLYTGNHRTHKNLQTLLTAWHDLMTQSCDLVITEEGPLCWVSDGSVKTNGTLHLPGHVELDDLVALYAGCVALVQPSLYEGFGLSVLEAMACGAPVIVAQTPALLEVGSTAVASFAPTDAARLAGLMSAVLSDGALAATMRANGRERVRSLTWDAAARGTAALYREALSL
jgi:glycosyltransferase involved in cell wall biosynthesis